MPLQHIADPMLKAMKRQITRKGDIRPGADHPRKSARHLPPHHADGWLPRRNTEDVEDVKRFLEEVRFDRVGVFTYSHEENTSAYELEDNIPAEEKERRAQDIMETQQEISLEKNQEKVGKVFKVIIDKKESGRYLGRTEFDSVEVDNEVIINTDKS